MIQFRVLGALDLRGPKGNEILSVLSRPKHTAVLAYLAIAYPKGFHRRDKLAALFWPEHDQEHARTSLRGAVHYLRKSLGQDAVLSRGDEEIGLDWDQVTCDAVEFQRAVEAGDLAGALDRYSGELLEGFFLSGCTEFEQWLAEERLRLRELAAVAAWARAHEHLGLGRITLAERTGQKALSLVATDENEVRRFVEALAKAGDRAAAVRFCERFAEILKDTLDLEPSAETRAVEQAIRNSSAPTEYDRPSVQSQPPPGPHEGGDATERIRPSEVPARAKRPWTITAAVVSTVALLAVGAWLGRERIGAGFSHTAEIAEADLVANRVLVTLFQNQTGDEGLNPTGRWAAELIHDELARTGVADVLDLGPAIALAEEGVDATSIRAEALELGATFAVTGSFFAQGDSLVIRGEVLDVARGRVRTPLGPVTAAREEPAPALSDIARRAGGAVAFLLHPSFTNPDGQSTPPRSFAAYAEWDAGLQAYGQNQEECIERMSRAFELDSTFLAPLIHKVWALWTLQRYEEADSVRLISESLRDRATPWERVLLDWNRAAYTGDREGAYGAAVRMMELAPKISRYSLFQEASYTNRRRQALEAMADTATTQTMGYWMSLGDAYHALGEHADELNAVRTGREQYPEALLLISCESQALVALGRIGEALAVLDDFRTRGGRQATATGVWEWGILPVAKELRAHGHPDAARDVLNQSLDWYDAQPADPETQREVRTGRAETLYLLERWEDARPIYAALEAERPGYTTLFESSLGRLGCIAARLGHREEALRISDEMAALEGRVLWGANTAWRARIHAILGEHDTAVILLHRAYEEGMSYGLWLHRDIDLEDLHGDPGFEAFMRPRG